MEKEKGKAGALDFLLGKLVKVVYSDGGEVKVRKGVLKAVDEEFVCFETLAHTYVVRRSAISELRELGDGEGR